MNNLHENISSLLVVTTHTGDLTRMKQDIINMK